MTTPQPLKIIVVDDHPIVRKGMIEMINDDPGLSVVEEADNGLSALRALESSSVDVIVADFDMPEMNGLELAKALLARSTEIPIVLLTMHKNEELFNEALNCGVYAYLLKDEAIDNITAGIRAAAAQQAYVSPSLSQFIVKRSMQTHAFKQGHADLERLTPTERKVLRRIAQNLSSQEIAHDLGVSYRTITTHRTNIATKLNLNGKHPLLNFALANRAAIMSLT